ncbi:uncharacterized protein LDX57_013046 [Aspergillus melleus]|nr:uncharacterized protein LDX57_013046 [Aspergillus melleus]KAH8435416.1 hypothetical protein LDX57_013046 [Aspergillus melleus]
MKHQPSSPTPRYLSSGPAKIPTRTVHKIQTARRYPAESTRRPFRDTDATQGHHGSRSKEIGER